jgi:antitoxin (DNA-binding transcriptional repressor) of toxin-antitoxin stability system
MPVKPGGDPSLDSVYLCVKLCVMRTVTVREAQHNFAALVRHVQRGEEVEVVRRKIAVARLIPPPAAADLSRPVDWSELPARLKRIWRGRFATGASTDAILDDLRGER